VTEQKLRGPLTTSTRLGGQVDGEPVGLDQHVVLSAPGRLGAVHGGPQPSLRLVQPNGLVT